MSQVSKIRPGLLVALSVRLSGGVQYQRVDLPPNEAPSDTAAVSRWETQRTIADAAEYEAASKLRSKIRTLIVAECTRTSFGLLCPTANEADLDAAVNEARQLADAWNGDARHSTVHVYALKGRIAESDREAAEAITSEIRELLADMERALQAADADAIRDAATRARGIGTMLDTGTGEAVSAAIGAARKAARAIVAQVADASEDAIARVAEVMPDAFASINAARMALLDDTGTGTPATVTDDELPAVDTARASALDVPTIDPAIDVLNLRDPEPEPDPGVSLRLLELDGGGSSEASIESDGDPLDVPEPRCVDLFASWYPAGVSRAL